MTSTNPSSPIEQLTELLEDLGAMAYSFGHAGTPDGTNYEGWAEAVSAIVVESIGEPEKFFELDFDEAGYLKKGRNQLRAELRQKWYPHDDE